ELLGRRCGEGESSTFDRGKVFADSVDLRDGRAGGDEDLVECNRVFEGDGSVARELENGRAASADEEEDEGAGVGVAEQVESFAGGLERVGVRERMAARIVANAAVARVWNFRCGADAPDVDVWREAAKEGRSHRESGFAEGDDENFVVLIETDRDGFEVR